MKSEPGAVSDRPHVQAFENGANCGLAKYLLLLRLWPVANAPGSDTAEYFLCKVAQDQEFSHRLGSDRVQQSTAYYKSACEHLIAGDKTRSLPLPVQILSERKPQSLVFRVEMVDDWNTMPKKDNRMPPVHLGEILREDLMEPLGLTIGGLARDLKISTNKMSEIVNGRRALNADAALRLSRYFGHTPEFWINLQAAYDLRVTIHSSSSRIDREVRPYKPA